MAYGEQSSVEAGLRFKTLSGLVVQTTDNSLHIDSHNIYVHEVEIVEGQRQCNKFLYNLDYAEPA
jgi:hypothetical protein